MFAPKQPIHPMNNNLMQTYCMRLLRNSSVMVVFMFLMCFNTNLYSSTAASSVKPNFIIILIDDLGYGDIQPFGSSVNKTPNLEKMAAQGAKLTNFYTANVCSASRAQLLTGSYAKRISINGALPPVSKIGLNPSEKTIASLLKPLGYSTICIGKWHLGDQPEFNPVKYGFDKFIGIPYSNDMDNDPKRPYTKSFPPLPLMENTTVIEAPLKQNDKTEYFTNKALEFIEENKSKPFFLYLPHFAVHVPICPGEKFRGKSKTGNYSDWVEEVDWSVGQILDKLRIHNLDKNTLVLFTSDNGPWLTKGKDSGTASPLRGGKFTVWEGGIRAPTIAWFPSKIPAGSTINAMTSQMDLLPTIIALAGGDIPPSPKIDGKDIGPLLSGAASATPHEVLYFWNYERLDAIRSGDWKLLLNKQDHKLGVQPSELSKSKGKFPQLYNLRDDVSESNNLAQVNPEIIQNLMKFVTEMDKDLGLDGTSSSGIRASGIVSNPKPIRQ